MRRIATVMAAYAMIVVITTPLFAQEVGDYRTRNSGNWNNAQIWERFNGSAWVAIGSPPTGAEVITVRNTGTREDSVFVNVATSITGRLVNEGKIETVDQLTIADGGIYQHDRDAGKITDINWAEGSTLLMTGTIATAPDNRNQSYHHIVFNTPGLLSNLNMNLDEVTIGGNIRLIDSGFARWYLTSAVSNEGSTVTIAGDVIVEAGALSVHGTSNAFTTFVIHHHGNIEVTGGNFSISRGSQGLGTTTWYLYDGDFSMSNATTQSSTVTPGGARFVFSKEGRQALTLGEGNTITALPIEVSSGTTLDMGSSALAGSGIFVLNEGGTIATALPGGIAAIFAQVVAEVTLEDDAGFEFNGTAAQVTSSRMPAVVSDLIIDNPAGVTLSQETTINGVLRLKAGVFDNTIPFTLGPNGSISFEGGSLLHDVSTSSEGEDALPQSFFVHQNFPNPFNPSTVIRYGLPEASDVSINVYNILGQEVRSFAVGFRTPGVHEVVFDADGLSSGMYLYRVKAGNLVITKQMVLIE
jgi:hypothetical protein